MSSRDRARPAPAAAATARVTQPPTCAAGAITVHLRHRLLGHVRHGGQPLAARQLACRLVRDRHLPGQLRDATTSSTRRPRRAAGRARRLRMRTATAVTYASKDRVCQLEHPQAASCDGRRSASRPQRVLRRVHRGARSRGLPAGAPLGGARRRARARRFRARTARARDRHAARERSRSTRTRAARAGAYAISTGRLRGNLERRDLQGVRVHRRARRRTSPARPGAAGAPGRTSPLAGEQTDLLRSSSAARSPGPAARAIPHGSAWSPRRAQAPLVPGARPARGAGARDGRRLRGMEHVRQLPRPHRPHDRRQRDRRRGGPAGGHRAVRGVPAGARRGEVARRGRSASPRSSSGPRSSSSRCARSAGAGRRGPSLVQLVVAQAGANAASYWLLRDVFEAELRLREARQTRPRRTSSVPERDQAEVLARRREDAPRADTPSRSRSTRSAARSSSWRSPGGARAPSSSPRAKR